MPTHWSRRLPEQNRRTIIDHLHSDPRWGNMVLLAYCPLSPLTRWGVVRVEESTQRDLAISFDLLPF